MEGRRLAPRCGQSRGKWAEFLLSGIAHQYAEVARITTASTMGFWEQERDVASREAKTDP